MLFDPNITPQDSIYEYVRNTPECAYYRAELEALWKKYEPYADKDFVSGIANDFYSRFWEMYLTCTLMDAGFKLIPRSDLPSGDPDICIQGDQSRIWVEATAPGPGTKDDKVPDLEPHQNGFRIPEDKIILRYQSAICTKFKDHKDYREKKVISTSEPYVIAICNRKLRRFANFDDNLPHDLPYIVKAVLPLGLYTFYYDPDTSEKIGEGYAFRPEIEKASGASVSTRIFLTEEYAGISAVISSTVDYRTDYHELGNDFILVRNLMAANPLPSGWLRRGHEYWVESDNQDKILRMQKWGH